MPAKRGKDHSRYWESQELELNSRTRREARDLFEEISRNLIS